MKKLLPLIALAITFSLQSLAQNSFQDAYTVNPEVPSGLLEAVAWTNTHMVHLQNQQASCSGIPQAFGIMGLHDDGKDYFIENGKIVATLSGINIYEQKLSADNQIMAYALAFKQKMQQNQVLGGLGVNGQSIRTILHSLSEIPDSGIVNLLARDMQVYSILRFMNSEEKAIEFNFTKSQFNLENIFGSDNYAVLSSKTVRFTETSILSENNVEFKAPISLNKSTEFGPAIWNPAPSCNYSSRSGTAVSAITIHTIQGSYAGAISWSQNCSSNVSYHYVIRSSDGQVTQMVLEANKAWHVGSENPYTIGYEHEGYVDNPSWYTTPMYNSSAELSRDICNSGYGIPPLRTFYGQATVGVNLLGACTKIKGHQHFPNQSHVDPGVNWDWERYYRLINNTPPVTTITSTSGTFLDSGGSGGDYSNDERQLWLFQPTGATSVTLNFSAFNTELDYDRLFIYDGATIDSPLIGEYMGTNSPGTITSSGASLLVEFRSDCGTTAPGWNASYTAAITPPPTPANDECSGATILNVNNDTLCALTSSSSLTGATASVENTSACIGIENDDVWFSFIALDTSHTVSLLNIVGSTTDLFHSVWEGTCGSLTLLANSCSDSDQSTLSNLTIGTTYLVRVNSTGSNTGESVDFDICIGTPPTPVVPIDSIKPTTLIQAPANSWETTDFTVNFTDADNESGLFERFYLVSEKDLVSNDWSSNGNARFANENFQDNASNWLPVTGSFTINSGTYELNDVAEQNSNTYMSVQQNNLETYLYEWDQTITSAGTNQRAGIHFFCDNPNLSNRGNSYFVYLRENDNAVEIFSVDNNVFNSESYTPFTINSGQTYNCKVLFNPTTGLIKVYLDDELISEWTDTTPLTSGGFISLRTGGCSVQFDNIHVYHSRLSQVTISTSGSGADILTESENAVHSGNIRSIVIDSADNWSSVDSKNYLIDFTPPTLVNLNDGNATDIDTFSVATIEGNWSIEDIHSQVGNFDVAIGTAAGLDDVVSWTTNSISSVYSSVLSNPIINQIYYISVRATNNAGLMNEFSSDGQRYVSTAGINDLSKVLESIVIYPNPSSEFIQFKNVSEEFEVIISDAKGKICLQKKLQPTSVIDISNFSTGSYSVLLKIREQFIVKKIVVE